MRAAPLLTAVLTAGFVCLSPLSGQPPAGEKTAAPDLASLQGEWTIVRVELPPGLKGLPGDVQKQIGVTVRGNLLTVQPPAEGGRREPPDYALMTLDAGKSPRHLDLTRADAKGEPRRTKMVAAGTGKVIGLAPPDVYRCVYQLSGDDLVVAVPSEMSAPRPAGLAPVPAKNPKSTLTADRYVVAVLHMTRKK